MNESQVGIWAGLAFARFREAFSQCLGLWRLPGGQRRLVSICTQYFDKFLAEFGLAMDRYSGSLVSASCLIVVTRSFFLVNISLYLNSARRHGQINSAPTDFYMYPVFDKVLAELGLAMDRSESRFL